MATLVDQVRSFLEAEGFAVGGRRESLVGSRRTFGEETEYIYVWVPESYNPGAFAPREAMFLGRFKEASESKPTAAKFMVVPTLEGLSRAFTDGARQWYGVSILAPVWFFDTGLKWEISREAASASRQLRERGEQRRRKRVPQPYHREDVEDSGPDLLPTLSAQLLTPKTGEKSIHILIGQAGIGKSCLFEVIFADLHQAFMEFKTRGGVTAPRPLPLIPEYLPLADGRTVRSLLTAYLQTDFARPLRRATFDWMMTHGFATWMLDGLDEVIGQDPQFFDDLLDLMTQPTTPAKPKVLVCVRDSLLASNATLQEFCQECSGEVAIWHLDRWGMPAKRRFAALFVPAAAAGFINVLRKRPSLDEIASLPYYCDLLAEEFRGGRFRDDYSETSLLQHALSSLVERDYGKGFLDRSLVKLQDVEAFLEAVATEDFGRGFRGVPVKTVQDWARIVLPESLGEHELERTCANMVNLATFCEATPGFIRFSQEVLQHYLIGRRLIRLLEQSPQTLVRELAQRDLPNESLSLRLLAEQARSSGWFNKVKELVYLSGTQPTALRNALRVATMCAPTPPALRDIPFERHDLSGLQFRNLDLSSVSFRGCDLTNTEFDNCNLRAIDLEDVIIRNTSFLRLPSGALTEARVGDLTRFFSMRIDRRLVIADHEAASKWFQEQTGERPRAVSPCKAALQLRFFLNKFVYPDGTPRRDQLGRRGMLAGRQIHRTPSEVLEASVKHGLLIEEERFRDRIHRPEGGVYSELVDFAVRLQVSLRIRAILDDVCEQEACHHVPREGL